MNLIGIESWSQQGLSWCNEHGRESAYLKLGGRRSNDRRSVELWPSLGSVVCLVVVYSRIRRVSLTETEMSDSGIKRNVPIKMGDFSVIDTEFSSIRERFDAEMRKMEDEMNKFRSDLMTRDSNNFFKSTTR